MVYNHFFNLKLLLKIIYKKRLNIIILINTDGLDKMIDLLEFDSDKIIEDWLGDDSEPRKVAILDNNFSIVKL